MQAIITLDHRFVLKHKLYLDELYVYQWIFNNMRTFEGVYEDDEFFSLLPIDQAVEELPAIHMNEEMMYALCGIMEEKGLLEIKEFNGKKHVRLLRDKSCDWMN